MKKMTAAKHKSNIILLCAMLTIILTGNVLAQGLPQTDIWVASLDKGVPGQLSKINPGTGYNNQPHFSMDGSSIYYTREMPDSTGGVQTDIAAYNIRSMSTTMVNHSDESEYSPTPVPDRNALSVIQVEPDQKQRLWAIDISSGEPDLLLPAVEPVGYHAWFSHDEVAVFILGESFTLQTAQLGKDNTATFAQNIGRSIRKHPQTGEVLFVDKNPEPWQIVTLNPDTGSKRTVMPLFPGGEDFTIDSQGNYWTGNGSRLYRRSGSDQRWQLMADFSAQGIRNITRLALNPASDKIALVSDHNPPD